jgi:NADH-quinone oxidoreductase subunit J
METTLFYLAASVSLISTLLVVTRTSATHALIYLIISLLSIAVIFYLLGAPFAAALEIVIYAGAIMVLFLFVVMMLNLGPSQMAQERRWMEPRMWIGPSILAFILFLEVVYMVAGSPVVTPGTAIGPKLVGEQLFTTYLLGVELAGFLLLAALVGSYHVGRRYMRSRREEVE